MDSNTVEILIKARNAAGSQIESARKQLVSMADTVRVKMLYMAEGMDKAGQAFSRFGKNLSQIGMFASIAGAAISGPMILAFKEAEKYSSAVSREITTFKNQVLSLQISIAQALIPIIGNLNNILANLLNYWNSLSQAQQQAIVQTVFMTGVFLSLGGAITLIGGKILSLIGNMLKLGAVFATFAALHPIIAAIGIAIGLLGTLMFKFKGVSDVVFNSLEAGWRVLLIAVQTSAGLMAKGIALIQQALQNVVHVLSLIPGPQQKAFKAMENNINNVRTALDSFSENSLTKATNNMKKLNDAVSGAGEWAENVDNFKQSMQGLGDATEKSANASIEKLRLWKQAATSLVQGAAQGMENAMSTFFFDAMTGQLKSLQDYFASFGRAILQTLAQVIAKLLVMKVLQGIAGSKGSIWGVGVNSLMHTGGEVRKAHTGAYIHRKAHSGLSPDEINITALAGEGVISRKGMANIGGKKGLSEIESGKVGKDQNVIINVAVSAWDATDVTRNMDIIVNGIANKIRNNNEIRDVMRRYN